MSGYQTCAILIPGATPSLNPFTQVEYDNFCVKKSKEKTTSVCEVPQSKLHQIADLPSTCTKTKTGILMDQKCIADLKKLKDTPFPSTSDHLQPIFESSRLCQQKVGGTLHMLCKDEKVSYAHMTEVYGENCQRCCGTALKSTTKPAEKKQASHHAPIEKPSVGAATEHNAPKAGAASSHATKQSQTVAIHH